VDAAEMRNLGERNLRSYASLHDASVGFCERHLRRMRRHCERASVAGVPNFMHIALAVADVLGGQVERLVVGLEEASQPMTVDDWHGHRQRLDKYLGLFAEALVVLSDNYLPAVSRRFKAAAIWDALQPDLQRLTEVTDAFLRVKQRVAACTKTNLRVITSVAGIRPAGIFPHDLLHEPRWIAWADGVRGAVNEVGRLARETA
jgi:hypothetical protein